MEKQIFDTHYTIDEDGFVFNEVTHRTLKGSLDKDGYIRVQIYHPDGQRKKYGLHRLLMIHFKPCEGMENLVVNHIDGDKSNNLLDNLEWVSVQENTAHAAKLGLLPRMSGEKNGQAKLTRKEVEEIRNSSLTGVALSKIYGISRAQISRIKNGTRWT